MRGVFPTVVAIVFSLSLPAAAAPVVEDAAPIPAPPDPSEFQGKGPPTQKGPLRLSAEERAKSAKALVDRNGNGLSDGLEDRLATLGANELVDVIVTFSGPGNAASARAAVGAFAVKYEYHLIHGFAATMRGAQARALAAAPGVFRVEEDVMVHAFLEAARRGATTKRSTSITPTGRSRAPGSSGSGISSVKKRTSIPMTTTGTAPTPPASRRTTALQGPPR